MTSNAQNIPEAKLSINWRRQCNVTYSNEWISIYEDKKHDCIRVASERQRNR